MRDLHCSDFEFKDAAAAGAGLLIGAGIGAGLMYLFDPDRGRSRRSRLEAQAGSLYRRAEGKVHKLAQDVANRAEGVAAEAKHLLDHDPVDAPKLVARVRSKIGRVIRKPHDVAVLASDGGTVTLSGEVDAREGGKLLAAVMSVAGVKDVDNRLSLRPGTEAGFAKSASALASVAGGLITYAGIRALKRAG
jgi:gas vesicle protein